MKKKNDTKRNEINNLIVLGVVALLIIIIVVLSLIFLRIDSKIEIRNFDDCVKAGNPIMESYPRQCSSNGITFVEGVEQVVERRYVSENPEECKLIKFMCVQGTKPFFDENGCGCEGTFNENQLENLPELFREKAIEKLGVIPVEGFDAQMYKGTFKGLLDSDFDNALAIGGVWEFENGVLKFIKDESAGITSADGTLNDEGVLTLINNLEKRLNIKVNSQEDLDKLIEMISVDSQTVYCTQESRNVQACTFDYTPVCGYVQVECVTTPCNPVPETFSNACSACSNDRVLYYIKGECS